MSSNFWVPKESLVSLWTSMTNLLPPSDEPMGLMEDEQVPGMCLQVVLPHLPYHRPNPKLQSWSWAPGAWDPRTI